MARPQVKSGMATLATNWVPANPLTAFGVIAIGYCYQLYLAKTELVTNVFADAEALRVVSLAIAVVISTAIVSRALKEAVKLYTEAKWPPTVPVEQPLIAVSNFDLSVTPTPEPPSEPAP